VRRKAGRRVVRTLTRIHSPSSFDGLLLPGNRDPRHPRLHNHEIMSMYVEKQAPRVRFERSRVCKRNVWNKLYMVCKCCFIHIFNFFPRGKSKNTYIDGKNAVKRTIEMGVGPYVSFFSSCSICPNFQPKAFPTRDPRPKPGAGDASHDADDAPQRDDDDTTPPVSTYTTRRPVTSRIDLARAYARRFINRPNKE